MLVLCLLFNASSLAEVIAHNSHGHNAHTSQASHVPQGGVAVSPHGGEWANADPAHHGASHAQHQSAFKPVSLPGKAPAESLQGAGALAAAPEAQAASPSQTPSPESDECICDDVCCLSSASLSQLRYGFSAPQLALVPAQASVGYLSITLDLVLPPPNFS